MAKTEQHYEKVKRLKDKIKHGSKEEHKAAKAELKKLDATELDKIMDGLTDIYSKEDSEYKDHKKKRDLLTKEERKDLLATPKGSKERKANAKRREDIPSTDEGKAKRKRLKRAASRDK